MEWTQDKKDELEKLIKTQTNRSTRYPSKRASLRKIR